MKAQLALSLVAAAAIALAVAAPSSVALADNTPKATTTKQKVVVHKKRSTKKRAAYPALEPFRSNGFVGEFPGACAYDRAAGNCMIDLGYGRCVSCDIGGGEHP